MSISAKNATAADVLPLDYGSSTEKPTLVRYGVLAFLCTLALLLYIDRVAIGQAAPAIQEELGLSKVQMSWVFNAFTLAYCLFEVPTGHWGDRYGSRGVIARIVVCWSIFTALTGAAFGFWSLIAIRFLFGAGEAGAFPNTARVVTQWFPAHRRGMVRGTITFVSLVGAAIAPILAAYLIKHIGWRATFGVFGAVGIVWAIIFYMWFRDDPVEHPRTNRAEQLLIKAEGGPVTPAAHPAKAAEEIATEPALTDQPAMDDPVVHAGIPWKRVFTSPNTWLLGLIMGVSAVLFYMLFQWYPTYLRARGQGELASGWLTAGVMTGGAAGCLAGGLLADAVQRMTSERRWSRSFTGAAVLLLAALSVFLVRFVESAWAVTLCNASALFFMQMGIPTWWATVSDISGRHGAALWGLMNSLAGLGLMATTAAVGWFVQRRQEAGYSPAATWEPIFDGIAVVLALGAISWFAVNTNRSLVDPTPQPARA